METFKRICIKDLEIEDANLSKFVIKRGKEYITSGAVNGRVTVFTQFWVNVSVEHFAGAEEFTKEDKRCPTCSQIVGDDEN